MRYASILIISAASFWSCEETIILDLDQAESKIVIEGMVTNQTGYQFVKVTRSADFYDEGVTPRITDAIVTVTDNDENEFVFVHNPNNHPDSAGYYLPSLAFVGQIGKTYHLTVVADGATFEAEDELFRVTKTDSLKYQINKQERDDPKDEGKFYEVLLYAKEPQDTKDYYLFKFYRNDSLIYYSPSDIYFSEDKVLGEEINGVQSPVYYAMGDSARVEMYSISRTAYVFYEDLVNLINNDGGMFSSPPANCRNNLSNGALGFFQASAIDISGIRIE